MKVLTYREKYVIIIMQRETGENPVRSRHREAEMLSRVYFNDYSLRVMDCNFLLCRIALREIAESNFILKGILTMEEKKKNNKRLIAGIVFLIAVCVGLLFVYRNTREEAIEGGKSITVQVESQRDSYSFNQTYTTDEQYLGNFLDKEGLIGFDTYEYGRFITSVQGYEAKDEEQSWWCISVNGESAMTGVDEIVIADGDTYLLELKTGY